MCPFFTCLNKIEQKGNYSKERKIFTPSLVKNSTATGHNIPANVPTPFEIPIRILA